MSSKYLVLCGERGRQRGGERGGGRGEGEGRGVEEEQVMTFANVK